VFLGLASDRGAQVFGIDASEALLELARKRLPEADLRRGDMQVLPYEDDSFDLVTGFNSFFYAEDMAGALREAGRVARPGAPVVIQVFGAPGRCDLEAVKVVTRPYMPAPPPGAPSAPELWRPGILERLAEAAGLTPRETFDFAYSVEYPDAETLGRLLVAPAGIARLVGPEREAAVQAEIIAALAHLRDSQGSYRLHNEFHYLVATRPEQSQPPRPEPARSTMRATSTREETSSLRKMLRMCVSTVLGLRKRASAISGLVLRSTTSCAT
jgi:SAM-dependent methyltransferase